jgi:hypothetical protein
LERFVTNTKEYQDITNMDHQKEMIDKSFERWTAYLLMKSSNQGK